MSLRQRLFLLPAAGLLCEISVQALGGFVSGTASWEIAAALCTLALAAAWQGRESSLTVAFSMVAAGSGIGAAILAGHISAQTAGAVALGSMYSPPVAGLLTALAALYGGLVGWMLFQRAHAWAAIVVLGSAYLLRADVDAHFAGFVPLLVGACLLLVVLAAARDAADGMRGLAVMALAAAAIALCWQLPSPAAAWSRSFADPLARLVGSRYAGEPALALQLSGPFHPGNTTVATIRVDRRLSRPYWQIAVFDRYDGRSWTPTVDTTRLVAAGRPLTDRASLPFGADIHATVSLDQSQSALIFPGIPISASMPTQAAYSYASAEPTSASATQPLPAGTHYDVAAMPVPNQAGSTPALTSPVLAPYLELPPEPQRLHDLAQRLTAGRFAPGNQVTALVGYLRDSGIFHYDTSAGSPANADAVTSFLFHTHHGYCNQFASALAVLAREIDLPARIITGYVGGHFANGTYTILERDAHSWVEIYIAGYGWVAYDPTPGFGSGAARPGQTPSLGLVGRRAGLAGNRHLPPVSSIAITRHGHAYRVPIPAHHHAVRRAGRIPVPLWGLGLLLLILAGATLTLAGARRASIDLYAALAGGGSRSGYRIRPSETPYEFAERFRDLQVYDDARLIIDLYARQRFAGQEPTPQERRAARAAWKRLRARSGST